MLEISSSNQDKILKPMSLKQNFSWTFMGNVIYAASQWGILTTLAKLGTPETVGQYALGLAITAPIFMLFNLQLRAVQATDAKDTYEFGHYLGLRLSTSLLAVLFISLIILMASYDAETSWVIFLIAVSKAAESISDIVFGLLQKNERMDRIAQSQTLKGPLSLIVFASTYWVTGSIIHSIIGLIMVWVCLLLLFDFTNARYFSNAIPHLDKKRLWMLAKLSFPLGIVTMLSSFNPNIPRYFIEAFLGTDQLGFFAAITYTMVAGNTVINALGQSASPRLAKLYADRQLSSFRKLLLRLVTIGVCLGVVGILIVNFFGGLILSILYGNEYAKYNNIFLIVVIGSGIRFIGSFLGVSVTAARVFKIQPILNFFVVVVSLISSMIFIPHFGLVGAAYTLIISAIFHLIGFSIINMYILRRKIGMKT